MKKKLFIAFFFLITVLILVHPVFLHTKIIERIFLEKYPLHTDKKVIQGFIETECLKRGYSDQEGSQYLTCLYKKLGPITVGVIWEFDEKNRLINVNVYRQLDLL
jgi:hypothetical protein